VVRLMSLVAEVLLDDQFDFELGAARVENKVKKGEDVPEAHLRAFRMCREEVVYAWLGYVKSIVQGYFTMVGKPIDERRLFQYPFPEELWDRLRCYLLNLQALPFWVNRELATTAFGGKQAPDFWRKVFEDGETPQGQKILAKPFNLIDMIKDPLPHKNMGTE
jgi:hypothetical protein